MKKSIIFASIIVLAFASCSKTGEEMTNESRLMRFESGEISTKVTGNAFDSEDAIGIFVVETSKALQISGNHANNVRASFNGSQWSTSSAIYWPDGSCDVYAYYPYQALPSSITADSFSVQADQSSGIGSSDFLWAKASDKAYDSNNPDVSVALNFKHQLSKVKVVLQKGSDYVGDWPEDATFYIHSTVPEGTIDYTTGSVTKDKYASAQTITCHKVNDYTYEGIVIPQRISSRTPLVEMVSKGVSYLAEGTFNFKPGVVHTFTVTLNTSTESIRIDIGGDIEDWN